MDLPIRRTKQHLILPGLATAHSHAFQRALRGRTQRRSTAAASFWSWRSLMYRLVEGLDPDTIYALSRFAYMELAMSGVTAVGEFHYVHHARDGSPYADRLAMADAVIQAAKDVGIRLTLIRTAYLRGGYGQELAPAQRRFVDPGVEQVMADVEALEARHAHDPHIRIAVAAHSIRAVPLPDVVALAGFARDRAMPFHMHVAEQRRELEECVAETGRTPLALLADAGVLSPDFVAVHATHLTDDEIHWLGAAGAMACLCRTTERDLGDGLPRTADLIRAGAGICVGVDSHCSSDAFEELRAVELDERSRTEQRLVAAGGPELLDMGTRAGYRAIGQAEAWQADAVWLRADDPALTGIDDHALADGVIFGATPRAVDRVLVAGRPIVETGVHVAYHEGREAYLAAMGALV
jgi:formimidoylglutamate deiminase